MEKEIAGYPFVAHPLGIANNALIGVVNLPAFIDIAQHTALAIAHRAIRRNAPNIVVIGIANGLSHTFRAHHRAACHQQNQYKKSKNLHCSVSYLSE